MISFLIAGNERSKQTIVSMCSHPSQTRTHTHFASMYGAHVYTQVRGHTFRTPKQHPSSSSHHQVRSACSASTRGESDTCTPYTRDATQPSLSSWPSFGRQAWFDHRNPSACERNDAYPERTQTPYRPCTESPCGGL